MPEAELSGYIRDHLTPMSKVPTIQERPVEPWFPGMMDSSVLSLVGGVNHTELPCTCLAQHVNPRDRLLCLGQAESELSFSL